MGSSTAQWQCVLRLPHLLKLDLGECWKCTLVEALLSSLSWRCRLCLQHAAGEVLL